MQNVDELRSRRSILTSWNELDQRVRSQAVAHQSIRVCVKAKGGHFDPVFRPLIVEDN